MELDRELGPDTSVEAPAPSASPLQLPTPSASPLQLPTPSASPLQVIGAKFAAVTTIHGILRRYRSPGKTKRSVWTVVMVLMFLALVTHMTLNVRRFMTYPIDVSISIRHEVQLAFPAVTVCNMNPVRKSAWNKIMDNDSSGNVGKRRKKRATTYFDCASGWTEDGGMCYLTVLTPATTTSARASCAAQGGFTGFPTDQNQQNYLNNIRNTHGSDIWLGVFTSFVWANGDTTSSYQNLGPITNNNDCVMMRSSDQKWVTAPDCEQTKTIICEYTPTSPPSCAIFWTYHSGSCYIVTSFTKKKFSEVTAGCSGLSSGAGATGVIINNAAEQAYIESQVSSKDYWIGLRAAAGADDGTTPPYSNWRSGQPDTTLGCAAMDSSGEWYSADCNSDSNIYVCMKNASLKTVPDTTIAAEPSTTPVLTTTTAEPTTTTTPSLTTTTAEPTTTTIPVLTTTTAEPTTTTIPVLTTTTGEPTTTTTPSHTTTTTAEPTTTSLPALTTTTANPTTTTTPSLTTTTVEPTTTTNPAITTTTANPTTTITQAPKTTTSPVPITTTPAQTTINRFSNITSPDLATTGSNALSSTATSMSTPLEDPVPTRPTTVSPATFTCPDTIQTLTCGTSHAQNTSDVVKETATTVPQTTIKGNPPTTTEGSVNLDPPKRESFLTSEGVIERLAGLSDDVRYRVGFPSEQMILDCEFSGVQCSYRHFQHFANPIHGNCYTFNHVWNATSDGHMSYRTGKRHGLKLVLNLNQMEYMADFDDIVGARVLVHQPRVMPFPEDEGIIIGPGKATAVGIKRIQLDRISQPHGNCMSPKNVNTTRNAYQAKYPVLYSQMACSKTCHQRHVSELCGCTDPGYTATHEQSWSTASICRVSNETQEYCRKNVRDGLKKQLLKCDCPHSCSESVYPVTISTSMWPSDVMKNQVITDLFPHIRELFNDTIDYSIIKSNLLKVELYYEEFNYEHIKEIEAYPSQRFFSDLGGMLGLWAGCSILTIVEIVELFVSVLVSISQMRCPSERTSDAQDVESKRRKSISPRDKYIINQLPPDQQEKYEMIFRVTELEQQMEEITRRRNTMIQY